MYTPVLSVPSIILIIPASLVVFVELISHLKVTGTIVGRDLMADPGIERTLLGKGISTILSGMFGSTPNTTLRPSPSQVAKTTPKPLR
ncbi:MAG: solute carrier family 23 protein [Methanoregula sp.]